MKMKPPTWCCAAPLAILACTANAADDLHSRAVEGSSSCCQALAKVLGNKVFAPSSQGYNSSLATYWAQQEAQLHPSCIVRPTNKHEVSTAVKTLVAGDKKWPGLCQFAVRGGGHTPWAGSANIVNGITIDMGAYKATGLSADHSVINISPGAQWQDVYKILDPLNLSTSGGRVAPVGVGGLTTGGGISFFSPRYGFVCNNVQNFEVVLASGKIVNANDTSHADLARALRGGSNNFGVVTSIDMTVFEQGDFWGGFIGYNISSFRKQAELFEQFTANPNYDPYSALIHSVTISTAFPEWLVANNYEYTKSNPAVTYPSTFDGFYKIPSIYNTMRVTNLTDLTQELAATSPIGLRDRFHTATYGNSAEFIQHFFDITNKTVLPLIAANLTDFLIAVSFQPLPPVITGKSPHLNSLGLDGSEGAIFNTLVTVMWGDEKDDHTISEAVRSIFSQANAVARKMGLYRDYLYLNYADKGQKPIRGYGATSVARLRAASKKYDPAGVFQRQVPGGFKLSE